MKSKSYLNAALIFVFSLIIGIGFSSIFTTQSSACGRNYNCGYHPTATPTDEVVSPTVNPCEVDKYMDLPVEDCVTPTEASASATPTMDNTPTPGPTATPTPAPGSTNDHLGCGEHSCAPAQSNGNNSPASAPATGRAEN